MSQLKYKVYIYDGRPGTVWPQEFDKGWDALKCAKAARAQGFDVQVWYDGVMEVSYDGHVTRDDTYPPGVWKLDFPCRDYRKAEKIADACYVGESWWPTKGKR